MQIKIREVANKASKSSNYYVKVDNKYVNISKCLEKVTLYLDSTVRNEIDLVILNNEIEKVRVMLNKLVNGKENLCKHDLIVRTSKLLDKLMVIYYHNEYE